MTKQKNVVSKRAVSIRRIRFGLSHLTILAVVLGVGIYGVYSLVLSSAASNPKIVLPLPGEAASTGTSTGKLTLASGGLDIVVNVPAMTDSPARPMSVTLAVYAHNSNNRSDNQTARDGRPHVFEFTRFAYNAGFETDRVYAQAASMLTHDSSVTPFDGCFDIKSSRYGARNVLLGTLYMNLKYPYDDPRYPEEGGYMSADAYFAKGTCAQQLSHTSPGIYGHSGFIQVMVGAAQDSGSQPEGNRSRQTATGNRATGKGTAGTGTGAGSGGGGGSSANTQSNKPNPLPVTTSQGTTKQTSLNASPFYDGKQYAPGSDPIDRTFGNISIVGRKLVHGWLYLFAAILAIAGAAGAYVWRRRGYS
ncbi:hypothetical protein BH09PAT4_BH09PAT4_07550 [soil metagenome]